MIGRFCGFADFGESHPRNGIAAEQPFARTQIFQKRDIIVRRGNTSGAAAFIFASELVCLNLRSAGIVFAALRIEPVLRGDFGEFIFRQQERGMFHPDPVENIILHVKSETLSGCDFHNGRQNVMTETVLPGRAGFEHQRIAGEVFHRFARRHPAAGFLLAASDILRYGIVSQSGGHGQQMPDRHGVFHLFEPAVNDFFQFFEIRQIFIHCIVRPDDIPFDQLHYRGAGDHFGTGINIITFGAVDGFRPCFVGISGLIAEYTVPLMINHAIHGWGSEFFKRFQQFQRFAVLVHFSISRSWFCRENITSFRSLCNPGSAR